MEKISSLNNAAFSAIPENWVKTKRGISYLNIEAGFDIETSSYFTNDGEDKAASMYIWMFGIGLNHPIYYGRTWDEFLDLTDLLVKFYTLDFQNRLVIYIHNLAYEFQFMRKYFDWEDETVFATGSRNPIKAVTKSGIEFRDSLALSGMSLATTAKNLTKYKVEKLTGDLDYDLIRHHKTELTKKEMAYCENDIKVILSYIKEQLDDRTIDRIPMTNTGRVREYVRSVCMPRNGGKEAAQYRKLIQGLKLDPLTYQMVKNAFQGGFTHSNPNRTGMIIDDVHSYDLSSSYPTVMLAERFPMSRGKHYPLIVRLPELEKLLETHGAVFDIQFTGLKNKIGYESYISESKAFELVNPITSNGRIYEAEELAITITDIDLQIISKVYSWESVKVRNVVAFKMAYLPKAFIMSILKLYGDKTTLKGVEGKEAEYLLSKGMINSTYGMTVTAIIKDENIYCDDEWKIQKANESEKLDSYNTNKNRFLYYPWGVWITAYARRNLWSAIISIGKDYIYSDTDSVKFTDPENKHGDYIERYNKQILRKLHAMAEYYGIDKSLLSPKTIEGVEKTLGVWDSEGVYKRFKTLGAKRYLVQKQNGKYEITVAGLPKSRGMDYILSQCGESSDDIFNYFNDKLTVPAEKSGKLGHWYIDDKINAFVTDYKGDTVEICAESGVYLGKLEYTLSMSKQFIKFIETLASGYIDHGESPTLL